MRHDYVLDGTRIIEEITPTADLIFSYDKNGTPVSFKYGGTEYYCITNQQGDVMEIRDSSGARVGSYTYNAYGEIVSISGSMASVNPLRYRGTTMTPRQASTT